MSPSTAEQEIRALEDQRFQAMIAGDAATLERLLSDQLVYTHSNAGVDSKASLVDGIRTGRFAYQRIERPDQAIVVHGETAVVAGHARMELGGANPRTLNLRYTDVWVKGPGGWQMVAWQSTPIPG